MSPSLPHPPAPPTTSPSNSAPGAAPPNRTSIESPDGESATLTVFVPTEAKVTINGKFTKSTGSERRYVSYGLHPGQTYVYKIQAEIVRAGKAITDEQTVSLTAGVQRSVAFGFHVPSSERLATTE